MLDAVLLQPGIVFGQNPLGNVHWEGLTLLHYAGHGVALTSPDATKVVAPNRSDDLRWTNPDVQFADQNLMLASAYTANVAANIAVFNNQQIFAMPETYSIEMFYPSGSNIAVPMIGRLPKPFPDLGSAYKIDNNTQAGSFIEQNRLTDILVKAIEPLNRTFGKSLTKTLTVVEDEEGSRTLFCLVAFTGSPEDARKALDAFDRNWWLANARRFVGKLNFDFELA